MFHVPTQAGKYWQLQTPVQIVCQQCLTDWRIPHTMEVSWTVAAVLAGDAPHLEGLYLLFVSIQIFETWKKSRKLLLLVALCAICWRSWVLGLKLPKVNFTFHIWRMFRRSSRRPEEEWSVQDCQHCWQDLLRPGPAPTRTQSQSTESLASSSLGCDLHQSPIKSQDPINTGVDNGATVEMLCGANS